MKIFIIILIIAGAIWFYFSYLKNLGFFKNLFKRKKENSLTPESASLAQFAITEQAQQVLIVKCPKCDTEFILEKKSKKDIKDIIGAPTRHIKIG